MSQKETVETLLRVWDGHGFDNGDVFRDAVEALLNAAYASGKVESAPPRDPHAIAESGVYGIRGTAFDHLHEPYPGQFHREEFVPTPNAPRIDFRPIDPAKLDEKPDSPAPANTTATANQILERYGVQAHHWNDIDYVRDVLVRIELRLAKAEPAEKQVAYLQEWKNRLYAAIPYWMGLTSSEDFLAALVAWLNAHRWGQPQIEESWRLAFERATNLEHELRQLREQVASQGITIEAARRAIAQSFVADPQFRETYVANVALLLHARVWVPANLTECEKMADEVVRLIFES